MSLQKVVIVIILVVTEILLCSCYTYEDFLRMRVSGEYRKACSSHGTPPQPPARINTQFRLERLRQLMVNETVTKGLIIGAYIVTSNDEHQSEFVAEYDRRLQYISGFSGSYGDAIITASKAVLWTDGRYHLQADDQLDCNWLLMREGHANISTPAEWLKQQFPNGTLIGVDPKLIPQSRWIDFQIDFTGTNIKLVPIENNLIDLIWTTNRPSKRNKDVFVLGEQYSGKIWTKKVDELRHMLNESNADAIVVTALDEIAWLLNIRGRDIPYNPFVRSYLIVDMFDIWFFVNQSQLSHNDINKYFNDTKTSTRYNMRIAEYSTICENLKILSQAYKKVLIPSHCCNTPGASYYIYHCVPRGKRLSKHSPIIYMKAEKNPVEIYGMQQAHIRDAAAMCEFFAYFESRFENGDKFTELDVVKVLNEFRFEQRYSLGNSFRTIAGFGANGAQPHYEPTPTTNVRIFDNSTLVLDSGGQYYDGTTDVTRTLHLGTPTDEQKQAYTRVLIGQIQLSSLTFPDNMQTSVADVMARAPLWEIGLDYLHHTSHGVGSFLSVHESPISMHFGEFSGYPETLKPGYFLSNEPGFYKEGDFGIRLENVMEVIRKPWLRHTSGHAFLGFRTVTLVPYEMKLIDLSLLSVQHRKWLNKYNEQIRNYVGAELKRQNLMSGFYWMMEKTASIPEYGHGTIIKSQPILILLSIAFFIFKTLFY